MILEDVLGAAWCRRCGKAVEHAELNHAGLSLRGEVSVVARCHGAVEVHAVPQMALYERDYERIEEALKFFERPKPPLVALANRIGRNRRIAGDGHRVPKYKPPKVFVIKNHFHGTKPA